MSGYSVQVQGFRELAARLEPNSLLGSAIRKLLTRVGQQGRASARSMAPRRTGRLAASISSDVGGRLRFTSVPSFAAVRAKAVRTTGRRAPFNYGKLLEFSPRHGHKGWLKAAMERSLGNLNSLVGDAAKDIEARFKRS
jgi:hypothetical protein